MIVQTTLRETLCYLSRDFEPRFYLVRTCLKFISFLLYQPRQPCVNGAGRLLSNRIGIRIRLHLLNSHSELTVPPQVPPMTSYLKTGQLTTIEDL